MADLADYLELTVGQAGEQFRVLRQRRPVSVGRQVTFLSVETLLCLAASFVVNHPHFGGRLAEAVRTDPMLRQYYGRPPLGDVLILPPGAQAPAAKYLDWHRQKIFVA